MLQHLLCFRLLKIGYSTSELKRWSLTQIRLNLVVFVAVYFGTMGLLFSAGTNVGALLQAFLLRVFVELCVGLRCAGFLGFFLFGLLPLEALEG